MPCSCCDRLVTLFSIRMSSLNPVKMPQTPLLSTVLPRMTTWSLMTERMPARGWLMTVNPSMVT